MHLPPNARMETDIRGNEFVVSFVFPFESEATECVWLTPSDTAKELEISTKALARWAREYNFPHNGKEGKARRYDYSGVCRAMKANGKSKGGTSDE